MRKRFVCALFFLIALCAASGLQAAEKQTVPSTAVLLSDPHFDPFRDPTKALRLNAAPVDAWGAILNEPPSPGAAAAFTKLQADCGERQLDAAEDLLLSSFDAAAASAKSPAFVLVAGDLIVHRFDCRYRLLFPVSTNMDRDLRTFAEKTIAYVTGELRQRFPHTPVFVMLGNNDTGCADYRLDASSDFLKNTSATIASGWQQVNKQEAVQAVADHNHFGSYSLALPPPMQHARLLVLNDLYLSADYKGNCAGAPNPKTADELLKWTEAQLAAAKQHGEKVWVLTHIPPGVNLYSTYTRGLDICHGVAPVPFLATNALPDLIARYADTVRVVITGHTHIDEMHTLGHDEPSSNPVALKVVPSITPASNNPPTFLTATVDPRTGVMLDYQLHSASASTGKAIQWSVAYDFRDKYGEPAYTASALEDLFQRLASDTPAEQPLVLNYQSHAARGLRLLAMQALWPQYLCGMRHNDSEAFAACACQSSKTAAPAPEKR